MSSDPLEAKIENDFVDYAADLEVLAKKFKDDSDTGAPDRICLCPFGHAFFIEFKRKGEPPRKKQLLYHKRLRRRGFSVYICDTLEQAKKVLHSELSKTYVA